MSDRCETCSPLQELFQRSGVLVRRSTRAAILIGAEVFGAAFCGGWAFGILLGLSDNATYILQAVLMCLGVVVMTIFIRNAQRIEPF